jgi:hypothetical protein
MWIKFEISWKNLSSSWEINVEQDQRANIQGKELDFLVEEIQKVMIEGGSTMKTGERGSYLIVGILMIWLPPMSIFLQSQARSNRGGGQELRKQIPFSVTAGVPVEAAAIRVKESVGESGGIPFFEPVVVFPPQEDSFIVQSVITPSNLQVNTVIFFDVFFTVIGETFFPPEGTVRLTFVFQATQSDPMGLIPGEGYTQERLVQVRGGGLIKATFGIGVSPLTVESDLLTIQVGRQAKDEPRDTNPGKVEVEGVRITYIPKT